ncbi:MAG: ThiF family adenylyltransferase [Anaerolineales bacterium]|nr:MAG: ThiF family adenylyltransferase [Anaerolineales bacterium]
MPNSIPRKSVPELVAGRLAAGMLNGQYSAGSQLPAERDLIKELGVGRSSLREALKILSEAGLLDAQQGVGWFVNELSSARMLKARQLAAEVAPPAPAKRAQKAKAAGGPKRLPVAKEKPLHIPNLKADRLGTFEFISWWEREKVREARVMVVGAGALGNEVIKNLTLMGIGHLYIVDFDKVEAANLSRSILFREKDRGREKAQLAAARAVEINPDVRVQYLHGDVTTDIGLGVFRRMDVVIGCLDNREARLAVNRFAHWMNKPWVDGAIQELLGLARVFVPGEGACFECTLTEQARRDLAMRYSCPLLARQNILLGKVPTTPTIASIIGAMQSQEALKLIHNMPVEPGKVLHYNGYTNFMHTTAYVADAECESHWIYGDVTELPLRAEANTLAELLQIARGDLGSDAVLELDQELVLSLNCAACNTVEHVLKPLSDVSFEAGHCPSCGEMREVNLTHTITGSEDFLERSLASVGVPPLHILRATNGAEFRFYELSGDLPTALHFNDFDEAVPGLHAPRVRLGEAVQGETQGSGRVHLID